MPPEPETYPSTLIATLGGQPQVVTFTLDLLLAQGEAVEQVVAVYLSANPRYQQAFRRLSGEFPGDRYEHGGRAHAIHLRAAPVSLNRQPLAEIASPPQVDAAWRAFEQLFADLKRQNQRIHLSLSGGRRMLALLGLSCAALHFAPSDRAWHIYTPPGLAEAARDGALLHAAPGDGVQLVPMPLEPWAYYFPGLKPLLGRAPLQMFGQPLPWQDEAERQRCQRVWNALSARRREALRALATCRTRAEAAAQLGITTGTVDDYKKVILGLCQREWAGVFAGRFDYLFLKERFGPFVAALERV